MRSRALTCALLVLLVLLALAGCDEQSKVDANATITITGTLRQPDGSPVADRPVRLGAGVSVGDGTLGVLTLGLACTSGICSGHVKEATTDHSGGYRFTLKGRETQSSFGEARSELFTGSAAPADQQVSGASISARFKVQTERLRLPDLTLVDPSLAVQGTGSAVVASWSTTRSGPYALSFENDQPVPVWMATTTGSRQALDGRLLEDSAGRVVISGQAKDSIAGSDLEITWRSPGIGYASALGAPASRGRPCTLTPDVVQQPCAYTDGDLITVAPGSTPCPTTAKCAGPPRATVDLGGDVPAELVVVRGCEGGCAIDVSADGRRFTPAGSVSDAYGALRLPGTPIRQVRVGLGQQGLREISVWGPAPRGPALKQIDRDRLRRPYDLDQGSDGPNAPLITVAALLVAAGLLGVGIAIGRRRR
jgi:hypothetical protein